MFGIRKDKFVLKGPEFGVVPRVDIQVKEVGVEERIREQKVQADAQKFMNSLFENTSESVTGR